MNASANITAITPLKNPRGFVSIRSGATVLARIHAAEVDAAGTRVGDVVTQDLLARLRAATARSAARRDAERFLARRALSEQALRNELSARGHEASIAAAVVSAYRQVGSIDDARLAESAVKHGQARGKARRAIEADLAARGIDRDVAHQAATSSAADAAISDDFQLALTFARSRLRPSLRSQPLATQRRRLAAMLARRGHDESTIESVLRALKLDEGAIDEQSSEHE